MSKKHKNKHKRKHNKMSRSLRATDEEIEELVARLRNCLKTNISYSNDISVKTERKGTNQDAYVYFTPLAYLKVLALVNDFTTEVEWMGTVERIAPNEFEITDILVPPHTVGAATVTSDQEECDKWYDGLSNEVFNSLRFHGHSHVNMGVTPSGVDTTFRHSIVDKISVRQPNAFYIFLIFNKKHEINAEIYDVENNIYYGNEDVFVDVNEDGFCLSDFIAEAHTLAKEAPKQTSFNSFKASVSNITADKNKSEPPVKYYGKYADDEALNEYFDRY